MVPRSAQVISTRRLAVCSFMSDLMLPGRLRLADLVGRRDRVAQHAGAGAPRDDVAVEHGNRVDTDAAEVAGVFRCATCAKTHDATELSTSSESSNRVWPRMYVVLALAARRISDMMLCPAHGVVLLAGLGPVGGRSTFRRRAPRWVKPEIR